MQTEIDTIILQLRDVFARHRVQRAILFGSFARGEATRHSDVDLLVVQQTTKRWLDRYEGLLREVSQAVPGRDVDLLIYTPEELDRMQERPLIQLALNEGRVIYESDEATSPS
jgi:predicted nucleotidyltransferase